MNWLKLLTNPFTSFRFFKPEEPKKLGRPEKLPEEPPEEPKEPMEHMEPMEREKRVSNKLNDNQRMVLMEMIGRGLCGEEIVQEIKSQFNISISEPLISQYRISPKWKPIIKQYRDKYVAALEDVPAFHKRVRLDRAERAYNRAYAKRDVRLELAANRNAMEEVEGGGDITFYQYNQYSSMSDEELEAKRAELERKIIELKPTQTKENKETKDAQERNENQAR